MTSEQILRELRSTLEDIKKLLEAILDGEDAKYEALRSLDIEKLIESNAEEEELLIRFDLLEKKRLDLVERFAMLAGCEPNLSLAELSAYMPGEEKAGFSLFSVAIKSLTERLGIAAERNRHILASNSEIIGGILEIMEGNLTQKYDSSGSEASEKHNMHLLDHTV